MKKKCIVILSAMVLFCGGIANASEWNFYGSARVETFVTDRDNATGEDTKNFSESLQGNARIGAKVKVSDELTGRFEYGSSDGDANIRLLYGSWNFGPGAMIVGQDYTPLYMPLSNQVYYGDNGLGGWGEPYPGRHAQIKLTFDGFQLAMISPDKTYYNGTALVEDDVEVTIPRLELSYTKSMDNWYLGIGGGYNSFEIDNRYDVDSYVGIIAGKVTFDRLSLGVEAFIGQNVGNIVGSDVNGQNSGKGHAQFVGGNTLDNDAQGVELVLGYMINDMFALEAGYGYMETELDGQEEDDVASYYIQAPVTLAQSVFFIPEIGFVDYQQDDQDEIVYYGVKWQINF